MANLKEINPVLTESQIKKYHTDGYLVLPDFLTKEETSSLKAACRRIVDGEDFNQTRKVAFQLDETPEQYSDDYFLSSGDKVRIFFEEEALDSKGNLKVEKHLAINKIGHALHWKVPEFKKVSFSTKVKKIAEHLNFKSPALVQSMYIFKQPHFGGEVNPHKDCTFLSTDPQSCVGLWFALEDAAPDNGCLWFSPGSHKTPTKRRMIRNPNKSGPLTIYNAPPDPYDASKYVCVPASEGTLVLINGEVDHRSPKNESEKSRHIYTFHMIEREDTIWDPNNWLQPTPEMPFTGLYENDAE